MFPSTICRRVLFAALALIAAAGPVRAQSDPPDRVARVNYLSGQVSFRPAGLEEWGAVTINYPLTTGDHLWTEREATAELHVGSSVIRLAPETAFSFLNLDDNVAQVRVAEGRLDLRVREIQAGEAYEVDTPNVAVSILRPGTYTVDVDPDGERTRITVREGVVEVNGGDRTFAVYAGEMAEVLGIEDVVYDLGRAPAADRWEMWCRDRDRREDTPVALNYVSREMIGYEDLDDYGTWSYVPEYGYAWEPTVVAVDWAPYRYGRWAWVRPWGWTWIDNARWGFAPFHYGRWARHHDRWIWVPGQRVTRPFWAPALVAFVGGRQWDAKFAFGVRPAVGWFPLAPGEAFCPSYRASPRYWRNVNAPSIKATALNVTNLDPARLRYANRDVAGAMTAVPRDMFVGSQPVQRTGIAVPRATAEQTAVAAHGAAVVPDATSIMGRVPPAAARPPAAVMRRAVVARTDPPAAVTDAAPVVSLTRGMLIGARPAPAFTGRAAEPLNTVPRTGVAARPRVEQPTGDVPAGGDRRSSAGETYYVLPRAPQPRGLSPADRPAAPAARPRGEAVTRDNNLTAAPGPAVVQPAETQRVPDTQRATPRYQAPSYEAPTYRTPRYQAPSRPDFMPPGNPVPGSGDYTSPSDRGPRYHYGQPVQAAPREDRPAPSHDRVSSSDDRPAAGAAAHDVPAPAASARPRGESHQERPTAPDRAAAPAPAPAPSSGASERAQPRSGGQTGAASGGQSGASVRPRGGRGGM